MGRTGVGIWQPVSKRLVLVRAGAILASRPIVTTAAVVQGWQRQNY
jgi:hypothetical protein